MKIIGRIFRMFRIDYEKLHSSRTEGLFWLDVFMLFLVGFNLLWIGFEMAFAYEGYRQLVEWVHQGFHDWYALRVHPDFLFYDLVFVAVFLAELSVRWVIAVRRRTYERWFFYPFVHWYDVLGCLPMSSFRMFRLLRVFSMILRMQRYGIIDLRSTYVYRKFRYYTSIITEEISDRVVINVLSGIQDEVGKGHPVINRIVDQVLMPRQEVLASWISRRVGTVALKTLENNEAALQQLIRDAVAAAMEDNKDIARLKLIPGAGGMIASTLKNSVSDITFNAVRHSVEKLSEPDINADLMKDVGTQLMRSLTEEHEGEDHSLDQLISGISRDILEVIKEEVAVQQWKLADRERRQLKASI